MSARRCASRYAACASLLIATALGCSSRPNQANIQLRKDNQTLQSQVTDLQTQNAGLKSQVQAADANSNSATPHLPESKLEKLFTVHGLKLDNLTEATKNGLRVYAVPTDDQGQPIKMAGSFRIEAFDLTLPNPRIGQWNFTTDQSRDDWYGQALQYTYELPCPWQRAPAHSNVTVKATFTDELTGRQFEAKMDVTVSTIDWP